MFLTGGGRPERCNDFDLQGASQFSVLLDTSRPVRAARCLPALQRLQRVGVVAAHLAKSLIGMETVVDRRRVFGEALHRVCHPGIHLASAHEALAPDAKPGVK
ncbi:MAG: hypothetical protein WA970_18815 [Gammaproteobacteria bacterium]